MAATILTPAMLAEALGTDARTARKFLRSITPKDEQPGKGSRWGIEKAKVRSLRKQFAAFQEAQEKARQDRAEKRAEQEATAPTPDAEAIDETIDEDADPTPEALAEIESEQD